MYSYLAHGTATDYMFEELHVPLPFTWEIYGDEGASCNCRTVACLLTLHTALRQASP